MQELLLVGSLFLSGFLMAVLPARTQPSKTSPQSDQQSQQAMKSIAGTVSSIGDQGHSFALEVKQGNDKVTLQFVLDKETRVQGHVNVGTPVKVEYIQTADQNVAKTITVQT